MGAVPTWWQEHGCHCCYQYFPCLGLRDAVKEKAAAVCPAGPRWPPGAARCCAQPCRQSWWPPRLSTPAAEWGTGGKPTCSLLASGKRGCGCSCSSGLRTTEQNNIYLFLTQSTGLEKSLIFRLSESSSRHWNPRAFCSCSTDFCGNEVSETWAEMPYIACWRVGLPSQPWQGRKGAKTAALDWQLPLFSRLWITSPCLKCFLSNVWLSSRYSVEICDFWRNLLNTEHWFFQPKSLIFARANPSTIKAFSSSVQKSPGCD